MVDLDAFGLANLRACGGELDDQLGCLAVDAPRGARRVLGAAAGAEVKGEHCGWGGVAAVETADEQDLVWGVFVDLFQLLGDGFRRRRRRRRRRRGRRGRLLWHEHSRSQVAHGAAVGTGHELANAGEDGVEDVDAVDSEQVAADIALQEVLVARARNVMLPDTTGGVHVDAMDGAEAARGDDFVDLEQRWRHARLQADDRAHILGLGQGEQFTGLRCSGGEGPFDEDGFAGEKGRERDCVVYVDAGADDDQVDGGVGGEFAGGGIGFCCGRKVVGGD